MRNKTNRIIAVLMVMILAFNFAACSGAKKLSGDPSDVISSLEKAIQSSKEDDILGLTMVEKGSSLYKEYKDSIDVDLYSDDMADCYKAVAKNVKIKFSESDIETGNGMCKVKVTFVMPDWQASFADQSVSSSNDLIEAIGKAKNIEVNLTLRLIDTKDGLKIKNVEDLMDVMEFIGSDIASATAWDESGETKPGTSETTEEQPKETKPSESEPAETKPAETEPAETKKPTKAPQPGSKDDLAAAYADYKKILEKNADSIAWFEKNVSKESCGLADTNNDGIPELFFFSKNNADEKYSNFSIYSYTPMLKSTSVILSTSLTEYDSKVSEFAVIKSPDGDVVTYRGFIDEKSVISYYNLYEINSMTSTPVYSGFMICGLTNGDKEKAVCSVSGFDKYTSSSQIKYDEYLRIEKDIMSKADILFGSKFLSGIKSTAQEALGGRKNDGQSYAEVLKQLG